MHRAAVLLIVLLSTSLSAFSQQSQKEENDSLVRLLTASRAQLLEENGAAIRKVEGDVMFLHNNTYLYCDTALWCVEGEYIDAMGHVQIVQDNAILSSERLHYDIPNSLATFRGALVQLEDRDSNILRSSNLDYNTRDSIAYFRGGASMMDKDGNVIESQDGKFDSKSNVFTFSGDVEMFSDSAFFSSATLLYETKIDKATFGKSTKGWYGNNHIRSEGGWYDKQAELVCFNSGVYVQTEEYEAWCDELRYEKLTGNARMYRDVQVLDTVHHSMAAGGVLKYDSSPKRVLLTDSPSVIGLMKDNGSAEVDSMFLRADTLIYESLMKYQIQNEVANAQTRLQSLDVDVVQKKKENDMGQSILGEDETVGERDSISAEALAMSAFCDSLSVADSLFIYDSECFPDSAMIAAMDSVVTNWKDTSQVKFFHGYHNVRMFKSKMQMICDSLEYSDLDSIVRLYTAPIVWKDITTQLCADSIQFVIRNNTIDRGMMLSNAMIVAEQVPEKYYHQIKSPEMTGFFAEDGSSLKRFDAFGGVQALFFMEEDSVVTMMNQKEAKILSATFRNGNVKRVLYMDGVKSDVYPVRELWKNEREKLKLKGFEWYQDKRPTDRFAITSQTIRKSIRTEVCDENQFPVFTYTDIYFPKYMKTILNEINERKPLIWKPRVNELKIKTD